MKSGIFGEGGVFIFSTNNHIKFLLPSRCVIIISVIIVIILTILIVVIMMMRTILLYHFSEREYVHGVTLQNRYKLISFSFPSFFFDSLLEGIREFSRVSRSQFIWFRWLERLSRILTATALLVSLPWMIQSFGSNNLSSRRGTMKFSTFCSSRNF